MVRVSIFTNEISPDGELSDRLAATFEVRGQEWALIAGERRYVQLGMPVFSARYDRQIDFDTDGEEWARNLPRAYRNGALATAVEEIAEESGTAAGQARALANEQAQQTA